MEKTLVIVAHPNLETSIINKSWMDKLAQYPEQFTVHNLYQSSINEHIDVEKEQALVEAHRNIVFQFPFYWFSCTPLLKKWFDEVLTYGWAYGSQGKKLQNKKIALAISMGSDEIDYQEPYTVENLLLPFKTTFKFIEANFCGVFTLYGAHTDVNQSKITKTQLEKNTDDYVRFLQNL